MYVGIHQPNYIPWAGYFYKILKSDIFVFLDDVQYEKNGFADRNSIKTPQGKCYLKIPVNSKGLHVNYNEILMKEELQWRNRHQKIIEMNYKRSAYFQSVRDILYPLYEMDYHILSDFNICFIQKIVEKLGFHTKFLRSSDLKVEGKSTERLINIIQKVNGDTYISGEGGAKYQDEVMFQNSGIKLVYSNFIPPVYSQLWGTFIPNLSILDLLFNLGFEGAAELLKT